MMSVSSVSFPALSLTVSFAETSPFPNTLCVNSASSSLSVVIPFESVLFITSFSNFHTAVVPLFLYVCVLLFLSFISSVIPSSPLSLSSHTPLTVYFPSFTYHMLPLSYEPVPSIAALENSGPTLSSVIVNDFSSFFPFSSPSS